MEYPWAVIGAKVVCIEGWVNTYEGPNHSCIKGPTLGEILTIREIEPVWGGKRRFCLRFEEYLNPPVKWSDWDISEQAWYIERFKPVENKKLPEALTSLLINPKKKIEKDQFDRMPA